MKQRDIIEPSTASREYRMQIESPTSQEALNPEGAFIIQVGFPDPLQPSALSGRIEHIESGDRRQFTSLEHLATILDGYRPRR